MNQFCVFSRQICQRGVVWGVGPPTRGPLVTRNHPSFSSVTHHIRFVVSSLASVPCVGGFDKWIYEYTLKQSKMHMTSTRASGRLATEKLQVVLYCSIPCARATSMSWDLGCATYSQEYISAMNIMPNIRVSLKQTPKNVPHKNQMIINCLRLLSPIATGGRDPKFRAES